MLEYTKAGDGARLTCWCCTTMRSASMPTARPGAARHQGRHIHQALYDEAKKQGWIVISMKNDWKRIFAFET